MQHAASIREVSLDTLTCCLVLASAKSYNCSSHTTRDHCIYSASPVPRLCDATGSLAAAAATDFNLYTKLAAWSTSAAVPLPSLQRRPVFSQPDHIHTTHSHTTMFTNRPAAYTLPMMGYAVEWSPFDETKLAVSCSQNFGIIGSGQQLLLQHSTTTATTTQLASIASSDGIFDCTFSEQHIDHIAFASGDGSVRLWDSKQNKILREWNEHKAEVYSVDWNTITKEHIISGAWDNNIKLYHPTSAQSLSTYSGHSKCIYSTVWSPRSNDLFASASGDGSVRVWSMNERSAVTVIQAHQYEVLTVDWNKYNDNILISGSTDKSIRGWDVRRSTTPLWTLEGHQFAVRRVKCSPHQADVLASVSYDMSVMCWDVSGGSGGGLSSEDNVLCRRDEHTEFVIGCDWNMFHEGVLATCGWDEQLLIYRIDTHAHKTKRRGGGGSRRSGGLQESKSVT